MAEFVLKDASLVVNSVDLSDHVTEIRITYEAEIQDKTAMGDSSRTKLPGLTNWTAEVTFNQDYAASNVDATLFPLVGAAAFTFVAKPTSGAVAATNPSFSGNALLPSYQPLSGSIGEVLQTPVSFEGDGALSRNTS